MRGRAGGLRRAAAAVVGAVRSAMLSGAALRGGRTAAEMWDTKMGAVIAGWGRGARAGQNYRLCRAMCRWGEKRPSERSEVGR